MQALTRLSHWLPSEQFLLLMSFRQRAVWRPSTPIKLQLYTTETAEMKRDAKEEVSVPLIQARSPCVSQRAETKSFC